MKRLLILLAFLVPFAAVAQDEDTGDTTASEEAPAAAEPSAAEDVTDEEILARLDKRRTIEGRADDDPAAVATRLRRRARTGCAR